MRTLNAVPAVCDDATADVPPDCVTENCVTAPNGVTDEDADDAAPVPFAFVAVTVNVYAVPAVRPETVHEVSVAGLGVQVKPPGEDVTVYDEIAEPAVCDGAVHDTVACNCPAVADTIVGAPGVSV